MDYWSFHEYIAVSCSLDYTMPLGLLGSGPYFFRVYKGAGLERVLGNGGCLLLLAPRDPELFLESILHEFERNNIRDPSIIYSGNLGSWFSCTPIRVGESGEYTLYECDRINPIVKSCFNGYHRGYGCLLELLIIYTKARAGVVEPSKDIVSYLLECMGRSGSRVEVIERVKRLLQDI